MDTPTSSVIQDWDLLSSVSSPLRMSNKLSRYTTIGGGGSIISLRRCEMIEDGLPVPVFVSGWLAVGLQQIGKENDESKTNKLGSIHVQNDVVN